MKLTKRNHYNPCFWTAHWNPEYYRRAVGGDVGNCKARDQKVFALNVKSGSIHYGKVDNVHYDKNLGVAEISREDANAFCRRHFPDKYEDFCRQNREADYPVCIDGEQLLNLMESLPSYDVLLRVIRRRRLDSPEDKCFLASFVFLQHVRSHAIMNSMVEWHREIGLPKFEHFVTLKWMLEDRDLLMEAIGPLVLCRWTFYATRESLFPLCDSPVLMQPNSVMVALSPNLLLEIAPKIPDNEYQWRTKTRMKRGKLAEFRKRTIGNTFREIIFSERPVLEYWQTTADFQRRHTLMRNQKEYNKLIRKEGSRETWSVNAYGNK